MGFSVNLTVCRKMEKRLKEINNIAQYKARENMHFVTKKILNGRKEL